PWPETGLLNLFAPRPSRRALLLLGRLALWPAFALLRFGRRLFRLGEQDDLAAGRLHRLDGRLGRSRDLDRDRRTQRTLRKQPDAVARPPQHAGGDQLRGVEATLGRELPGIDCPLQPAEIDNPKIPLKDRVVEAALRQAAVQRRLAALEAVQRDAGARGLALAASPGGLALTRTDAAADPLGAVMRAGIVSDLVELHRLMPRLAILC